MRFPWSVELVDVDSLPKLPAQNRMRGAGGHGPYACRTEIVSRERAGVAHLRGRVAVGRGHGRAVHNANRGCRGVLVPIHVGGDRSVIRSCEPNGPVKRLRHEPRREWLADRPFVIHDQRGTAARRTTGAAAITLEHGRAGGVRLRDRSGVGIDKAARAVVDVAERFDGAARERLLDEPAVDAHEAPHVSPCHHMDAARGAQDGAAVATHESAHDRIVRAGRTGVGIDRARRIDAKERPIVDRGRYADIAELTLGVDVRRTHRAFDIEIPDDTRAAHVAEHADQRLIVRVGREPRLSRERTDLMT